MKPTCHNSVTKHPGSDAVSIPQCFEQQVAANRERIAVRTDVRSITYGALNTEANQLAHHILAQSPHTQTVALLLGQGVSVTIAVLGALKAGKVVVPLDVRQPAARVRQILDDCDARLLITDDESLALIDAPRESLCQLLNIDTLDRTRPSDEVAISIRPDEPACLIYTSGSTGTPKGVVQTHGSLLNRSQAFDDVLQVTAEDRLSLVATASVAQGLSGTLQALIRGASIHPFDLRALGINELGSWLAAHQITVLTCSPSAFRHFARTLTPRDAFPALRAIRLGSEQVLPDDFALFRQHFGTNCTLLGTLGSTEAGPVAICRLDHNSVITNIVPAGYPLPGTVVKLLDDDGRVCPPGEAGEIVVRNTFATPGYWRNAEQTAALFVDVPGITGPKFCRTGDIAVMRADGCLEYVGRKNLRVKIRGFRVELEEIERALCAYPSVLEAAVVARTDDAGESRLTAFVVSGAEPPPEADELRRHTRRILPEQMVPASIEFLPSLPRTAGGKVNRTALQPVAMPRAVTPVRPVIDVIEMYLTSLWEELLDHHPIEVTENFFALGGHSLLAARLSASIERAFGVKLPLATFFTAATIEKQAQLIRSRSLNDRWPIIVPIRPGGSKPPLFCAHLTDGNVLAYRHLVRHLPPDQPVYGLQSQGLDGHSRIHTRIEDMARDYVAEIRKLQPHGPYMICGWSFGGVIAFEIARQLECAAQEVALLALFDSNARPGLKRARKRSLLHAVSQTSLHATASLRQKDPLGYVRPRMRIVGKLLATRLWRTLVLWYRAGGWLPRRLRNLTEINRQARRDYTPQPYGGGIMLFKAIRQSQRNRDPLLGWGGLAGGGLKIREVPGTHSNMVFEPHAQTLAAELSQCLEKAWAFARIRADGTDRAGNRAS